MQLIRKYHNGNTIWRILISDDASILVETRDSVKKQVAFEIISPENAGSAPEVVEGIEEFWTGVENFSDDFIIFHGFLKHDMPIHKGIYNYSREKNKYLWQNNELRFLFRKGNSVFGAAQKFETTEFYELDIVTGEIIQEHGTDFRYINSLLSSVRDNEDYSGYVFPEPAPEETVTKIQNLSQVKKFTSFNHPEEAAFGSYYFVSFHTGSKGNYDNYLVVFKDDTFDEIIKLNSATENMVAESWFIYNGLLILIINKNEIKIYRLD